MDYYEEKKIVAVEALSEIDPRKPYGTALFDALARVSVSVAIEAIALRRGAGKDGALEIFLRRRAMDDTAYPGEWHSPGSVMRPGESIHDVFSRLMREFGEEVSVVEFLDNLNHPNEERGHFFTPVYLVRMSGEGRQDDTHGWFGVDALPEPVVRGHRDILFPMAISAFVEQERRLRIDTLTTPRSNRR